MEWQKVLGGIAGLLYIIGFVPYIRAILKGARPSKASWLIWASLDTIVLAGMLAKHTLNGQMMGVIVGAWVIFFLSLKYGKPGWTKLDVFSIASATIGVILWKTLHNATWAIVISLLAEMIGAIPTIANAMKHPEDEDRLAWVIYWLSCVAAIVAIPQFTWDDAAQPIAFFSIETVMMYILFLRPRRAHVVVNV